MMTQVASLDPSVYEAVGPVDQPPEELNGATEVIGSAQYNVGRAYYEGRSTYAGKTKTWPWLVSSPAFLIALYR